MIWQFSFHEISIEFSENLFPWGQNLAYVTKYQTERKMFFIVYNEKIICQEVVHCVLANFPYTAYFYFYLLLLH